ncbi:zinc finger protein 595 isoform X2 [Manduca sexta]|uniref:zinc finger protein 595 isoform X2 n=1 Tax=Manduca sexta TaxID=7130 RepID=UPI00188F0D31|nr:zinc finger protein 595 isoform X2 [Manduca sexta]
MSQFLDITLPEYVGSDENIEEISIGTFCVCCLSRKNVFVNLLSCKHSSFLECFFKYKRPDIKVSKFHHLQVSKTETTSVNYDDFKNENSMDDDCKSDNEVQCDGNKVHFDIATEVKVERDSSDQDVPLAEVKKQRKRKRKELKKDKVPKKRSATQTIEQKYAGKLRTVTLTEQEMLEERRELSREEKYLRLPYKCESCVVGFEFEMAWKSHVEKQHNKTGFTCELCKSVLSSASSLKEHGRRHLRRYECTICKKRYKDEYSAVQHFNELHSVAGAIMVEFQCPQCDFSTRSHRSLRYHRSKHKQDKDKCSICGNEFTNKSSLKIHMYTLHKQSSRVYKCEPCGKVYRGKSGLFTHLSTAHDTADRRAYCVSCRTYYRTAHNLAHHLRTHSSHITEAEKKFGCDECGSRFISKSTLKSHIEWEHLEIRNNRCTKCSKVFRRSTTLKKHVEFVHEKKRPPRNKICDYCGQGFTTAAILRSHIRTHTGERPHRCVHCGATFAHSSALYNHNRLLHNPERDRRQ